MTVAKERIQDVIRQVVPDDDAQRIIFYLQGKANISEFIIAEELDLEIHRTRNLLYQLLDVNLVSFKRKKDKIKGWYICYWDFNESSVPHLEESLRLETIKKLSQRLKNESTGQFYMCRYAHARMGFEDAFEEDFKCPECGDLMNQVDNARTIEFLTSRIEELQSIQKNYEEEKQAFFKRQQERAQKILDEQKAAAKQKAEEKLAREQAAIERKEAAAKKKAAAAKKKAAAKEATKKVAKKSTKKAATKPSVKKTTAKKVVKKAATKKSSAKKSTKTASKKTASKKSTKKSSSKKSTAKKTTTKKTVQKKTSKKVTKKSTKTASKKVAKKIGPKKK